MKLATEARPGGGNTSAGHTTDRSVSSGQVLWPRVAVSSAVVVAVCIAVGLTMPSARVARGEAFLGLTYALMTTAGLSASIYCFATFLFSRHVRYLLLASAFFALSGGAVLQVATDLFDRLPAVNDWITTAAWFFASVLLAGALHSTTVWHPVGRTRTAIRTIVAVILVMAYPLAVVPYVLNLSVLYGLDASPDRALMAYVTDGIVNIASSVLLFVALLASCRAGRSGKGEATVRLCYFLAPCMLGIILRSASATRFDWYWIYGQLVLSGGWLVLVSGFGVESAKAHKEAGDRLQELEDLHEVSWSLVGATDAGELYGLLARTLRDRMDAKIVAIYLADGEGQALEVAAVAGTEECLAAVGREYAISSADRRPGFHTGHAAKAFVSKEMQVAEDIFVDVELVPWRTIAVDDGRAVWLPLVDQGEAIGVLGIYFSERAELTTQRLKLLVTIAAAVSPAIDNVRHSVRATVEEPPIDLAA